MPRYVAFLRAVNVGGRVVKMDELRRLFAHVGFADVETFIASGNVIFSSPSKATAAVEQTIERALEATRGYAVPAFVRSLGEVAAAASHTAFSARDVEKAGAHLVAFVKAPLTPAGRKGLAALESAIDRFAVNGREIYWLSTPRQNESKLTLVKFERAIGGPATMRAMSSVGKLAGKHCQ